jgi:hypothetical protein
MFPHWPAADPGRQRTVICTTLIEKSSILQVYVSDISN